MIEGPSVSVSAYFRLAAFNAIVVRSSQCYSWRAEGGRGSFTYLSHSVIRNARPPPRIGLSKKTDKLTETIRSI
jgi:hypothetical protein